MPVIKKEPFSGIGCDDEAKSRTRVNTDEKISDFSR